MTKIKDQDQDKKNLPNKKLIIFLDEKGEEKGIYAEIIEQTSSTITFKTKDNIFTIPICRLIKIKEPIEES